MRGRASLDGGSAPSPRRRRRCTSAAWQGLGAEPAAAPQAHTVCSAGARRCASGAAASAHQLLGGGSALSPPRRGRRRTASAWQGRWHGAEPRGAAAGAHHQRGVREHDRRQGHAPGRHPAGRQRQDGGGAADARLPAPARVAACPTLSRLCARRRPRYPDGLREAASVSNRTCCPAGPRSTDSVQFGSCMG
jgi:hypothetical protein